MIRGTAWSCLPSMNFLETWTVIVDLQPLFLASLTLGRFKCITSLWTLDRIKGSTLQIDAELNGWKIAFDRLTTYITHQES